MTTPEKQRLRAIERAISSSGDYSVLRDGGEELVRRRATELGTTATDLMHKWAGESKPPVPRNSPHPTPPPRRDPEHDFANDADDKPERESPEPFENDDDDEAGTGECMCDCGPCLRGDCEHCSDSLCRDPNCKHADSDDDDFE
jgi:hypothetical protein